MCLFVLLKGLLFYGKNAHISDPLSLSLSLLLARSCKIESVASVGGFNDAELMHGLHVYVWMNLCILPLCAGDRKNSTAKNRDGWI